jgi:hypothetical protein
MTYKASIDKLAKWITCIMFLIFISIGIKSCLLLLNETSSTNENFSHLLLFLFFFLILFFCWLYAPIHYIIDTKYLVIHRKVKDISINLNEISLVKLLSEKEIKGGIRIFGVGGVFGYFGLFQFPKIGTCSAFATQRKNMILIETQKKKYIISPDDIELSNYLLQKIETYK